MNRSSVFAAPCRHLNKKKESRVTFIVNPGRHPLLFFKRIKLDFPVFILWSFLSDPHCVVTRDAVISLGAFEESTLGRFQKHDASLKADKCQKYSTTRGELCRIVKHALKFLTGHFEQPSSESDVSKSTCREQLPT